MDAEQVCVYNKFGFCKYLDTCRFRHIQIVCEKGECEAEKCSKRHPQTCRYYRDYGRCKFGEYCFYKNHDDQNKTIYREVKDLKLKVEALEKLLKEKDGEIQKILENIKYIKTQTVERSNVIIEDSFSEKVVEMNKFELEEKNTQKETFDCDICDYESKTNKGLKIHKGLKHKLISAQSNPSDETKIDEHFFYCSECDKDVKLQDSLKFRDHGREEHGWFWCPNWAPDLDIGEVCEYVSYKKSDLKKHIESCKFARNQY